jgi:hypothetical protein
MSHFAKIENNIVTQVIVVEQDVINTGLFGDPTSWVQTSYNTRDGVHLLGGTPLRKNFAGVGYTYDPVKDEFNPPTESTAMETVTVAPAEPVITLITASETVVATSTAFETSTLSTASDTITL